MKITPLSVGALTARLAENRFTLLLCMLCTAVALSLAAAVQAADDVGLFELDENAVDEATSGDDAQNVFCGENPMHPDCVGVASPSGLVSAFIKDKVESSEDDIFTQRSKDSIDVLEWNWKIGSANDKNDIGSVFATLMQADNGDFYLYFGLDKFSNNGDAAIGFWFLQNDVEPVEGGTFSAGHEPGDVLIQADILKGGSIGRLDAYTWGPNSGLNQPVAPSQGDLTLAVNGAECMAGDTVANDDVVCGLVNTEEEIAPWPYIFKGTGDSDVFPPVTYFEGGINLSALFPNGIPCVSTLVAETRQSQSETAELEDLVIREFDLCSFDVRKTGPELSKVGDDASYHVEIENDGALPLTKVSIEDSLKGDLTDQCGATLDVGQTCEIDYTLTVPDGSDPLVNTVTATYDFGGTEQAETATHSVNLFTPDVALDKKADGSDGPVMILQGESVEYSIRVDNTSSDDTPTLACTITDDKVEIDPTDSDGDSDPHSLDVSLVSGGFHTVTASSGPLTEPGTQTNTAEVTCSPDGFTNVVGDSDSVDVKVKRREVMINVDKQGDGFSKTGDEVNYTITITNGGGSDSAVTLDLIDDTLLGDLTDGSNDAIDSSNCPLAPATLAIGDSCTIELSRTTQTGDPDPLVNEVTVTASDEFDNADTDTDDHNVDLVAPSISVAKTCVHEPVEAGSSANFRIDVENTGDVELLVDISDPDLNIDMVDVLFGVSGGNCTEADFDSDPSDGCFSIEAGIIAGEEPVTNQVDVEATLQPALGLPNVLNESAGDTCNVFVPIPPQVTRTLGFWKTHGSDGDLNFPSPVELGFTCHVAEDHIGFPISLGWKEALNCGDVFGIFWSSMAKESDGDRRDKMCKTKLHASWQLMAAILNTGLGTPAPIDDVTGKTIIEAMKDALAEDDRKEIIRLQGLLGDFNESGDDVAIVDDDGAIVPHADPNGTREAADFTFGDCPESGGGNGKPN